jgi:hypothetical protein
MTTTADFTVITYGHGSIVLLRGEHADARDHLEEHVQDGVWLHGCLAVDVRYLQGLIEGLEGNGFSVGIA